MIRFSSLRSSSLRFSVIRFSVIRLATPRHGGPEAPPRAATLPPAARRGGARAGFSLIEVLAALTITALVIGAFSPFVAQLIHGWGRGARIAEMADMLQTATARIDRDIVGAVPLLLTRNDETTVLFKGTESYLLFVSATGLGRGRLGLELLSFSVEPDGDARALVRRHGRLGTDPDNPEGLRDPVPLISGRFRITLAYRPKSGDAVKLWENRTELPAAIEVTLTDPSGVPVLPAPLVFAFAADYPAACIADEAPEICSALGGGDDAGNGEAAAGGQGAEQPIGAQN